MLCGILIAILELNFEIISWKLLHDLHFIEFTWNLVDTFNLAFSFGNPLIKFFLLPSFTLVFRWLVFNLLTSLIVFTLFD